MTDVMVEDAIASSVVGLARHVMSVYGKPDYDAYRMVTESKLYELLADRRTRLFLMTNEELGRLFDSEMDGCLAAKLAL